MVGKLTKDDICTSSIVVALFDEAKWGSKQKALANCIKARKGDNVRFEQTPWQEIGDLLEPVLIAKSCKRLGITEYDADITEKRSHAFLPLEASLDGIAWCKDHVVKEDKENGIYLPQGQDQIVLDGSVVIECKCTRDFPEDMPPPHLGVRQCQSSCEVTGSDFYIICILYNSTDLRTYVFEKDPTFINKLKPLVEDFNRRINEEDYYDISISEDAYHIYSDADVSEDTLVFDTKQIDHVDEYIELKKMAGKYNEMADIAMGRLMMHMGNFSKAQAANYEISWPSRNYKEVKASTKDIAWKAARTIRQKQLTIKDTNNG